MIRDRGRIKWNSLMLPEHVKMLRSWAEEDMEEQRKYLDEQKLEMLNEIAGEAMNFEKEVAITYFINHRYEQIIGKIHSFDGIQEKFRIIDRAGHVELIFINDIGQIMLLDE